MLKLAVSTRFVPVLVRAVVSTLLTVLIAFSIVAAISRLSAGAISASSKTSEAVVTPPLQSQSPNQEVQGLVIAIRPTGFTPAEIEVTTGHYLIIVQNRCGIRDLAFRFDREAGERLHEVHDQKLQWKKEFDLHPGTYVLSVVNHPTWRCLIKVKSR